MTPHEKGQHFLLSSDLIINHSNITKDDKVIEIGSGYGIITSKLLETAGEVLAFEIDRKFSPALSSLQSRHQNLRVIYDDALNYLWSGFSRIISNIPFYLSEKIILKSVEEGINEMLFIIGQKFKEKLEKKSNRIAILAGIFYEIEFIKKIDKSEFNPSPRVYAWLIRFRKRLPSPKENLIASIILSRGKLKNALLHALVKAGKTKKESREFISKIGIYKSALEKPARNATYRITVKLSSALEKIQS